MQANKVSYLQYEEAVKAREVFESLLHRAGHCYADGNLNNDHQNISFMN